MGIIRAFECGIVTQASVSQPHIDALDQHGRSRRGRSSYNSSRLTRKQKKIDVDCCKDGMMCVYVLFFQLLVTGASASTAVALAARAARRRDSSTHPDATETSSSSSSFPSLSSPLSSSSPLSVLGLPLGLHFNLTEGCAVSDGRPLLGKSGFWAAARHSMSLSAKGSQQPSSDERHLSEHPPPPPPPHPHVSALWIRRELEAQLDFFRRLVGREAEYVDGHNHIQVKKGGGKSNSRESPHFCGRHPRSRISRRLPTNFCFPFSPAALSCVCCVCR